MEELNNSKNTLLKQVGILNELKDSYALYEFTKTAYRIRQTR